MKILIDVRRALVPFGCPRKSTIHELAKSIDQGSIDRNRLAHDQLVRFAEIDLINEILFSGQKVHKIF